LFFIGESVVHLEMHKGIRSCSLFKMRVKYWWICCHFHK